MKTTTTQQASVWIAFFIVSMALFFSTPRLQAQDKPTIEILKSTYQKEIDHLDARWDENSYNMYKQTRSMSLNRTAPYALGIYSFEGNVKEVPDQRTADKRLRTLAHLLRKASDEIAAVSQQKTAESRLHHLKPLLAYIGYSVSTKPLRVQRLDVHCSVIKNMDANERENGLNISEALAQEAERLAASPWMAKNKHLAYKYLAASVLTIPAVWAYLEPEFVRMIHAGGGSTDNILFAKLHMKREPYIESDTRIWEKAPRFQSSQLQVQESSGNVKDGQVSKVEWSDSETRVTIRYAVGGHEIWHRYGKGIVLVDNETKESYPIKGLGDKMPLDKTFIVVGCENKFVDFTLIFPPIKKTLKTFVIDSKQPDPEFESVSETIQYYEKHNIMSDKSSPRPVVVYTLSDFVNQ